VEAGAAVAAVGAARVAAGSEMSAVVRAFVGLGSNLDDPQGQLERAFAAFSAVQRGGIEFDAASLGTCRFNWPRRLVKVVGLKPLA